MSKLKKKFNLNSAKIVNAGRRKMQKMDGWTMSQADAE